MRNQVVTNVRYALIFYRRNRLLLGIGILFLAIAALYTAGSMLFDSSSQRFELIKSVFEQLGYYTTIFSAALPLVLVAVHVRGKTIKTILTKPCPPEAWLGGGLVAAATICAVLNVMNLLLALGLSMVFGMPLQWGFVLLSLESFCTALTAMGYLMLLSLVLHPVIAVLTVVILSEGIFYWLRFGLLSFIVQTGGNPLLPLLEKLTLLLYMMVPMYAPFGEELGSIGETMRVTRTQWLYGAYHLGYAIALLFLCYLLSVTILRRKALI